MTRIGRIREVWASNLDEEIRKISYLLDDYDHVALDTEFPGVIVRAVGNEVPDTRYQTLRANVDLLKIIQIGITLSNEQGQSPEDCTTWQFNFSFSLTSDMYAQDAIDLLTTSGIDFSQHDHRGIDPLVFGDLLTSSGLVLNSQIKWVTFHGGYDFAYMLKLLTAVPLPTTEQDFFDLLKLFFPHMYDLKYLMLSSDKLYGGLNKTAELLSCERVGAMHQAGSDSLLTLDVFFKMKEEVFNGTIPDEKADILFSLGQAVKTVQLQANRVEHGPNGSTTDAIATATATPS